MDSVESRGLIEPIVITQNKMIVSGYQRVRDCKELGIKTVNCKVQIYNDEDKILEEGNVGGSAKKFELRIRELERIYGVRNESNNPSGINRVGS